jgi:dinuclear metal center YbgI/SA1388 family protein
LDELLSVADFPDYSNALNGLQVQGPEEVTRIAVAVDASEQTIHQALDQKAHLLVVHHGLFWDGFGPLTGPRFRKVRALIGGHLGLYSAHLPLDAHPEVGNSALLTRSLGLEPEGPFGSFQDQSIGCWAMARMPRDQLVERVSGAVDGEVRLIPGGKDPIQRVGVVTGGGASFLRAAAESGLDALVTGEAAHHHFHEAMEYGVNLLLAGHYATETLGVRALGEALSTEFRVDWEFLDIPTGM